MVKVNLANKKIVVIDGIRHELPQGEQEVSAEIAKELGIETLKPKAPPKKTAE